MKPRNSWQVHSAPRRPSPPVRAALPLPALIPLLLTAALATPLPAQPALTFEPGAVVATGMTPGGEVAWLGVWRIPLGSSQEVGALREVTPVDGGGEARLETGTGYSFDGSRNEPDGLRARKNDLSPFSPRRSIWAAVDLASGEYAVATPEDYPLREASFAPETFAPGPDGALDRMRHRHRHLELLLVRPGEGAWTVRGFDGGDADGDGAADGRLTTLLESLEALTPEAPQPGRLRPGDVVVAMDPDRMNVTAARLAPGEG